MILIETKLKDMKDNVFTVCTSFFSFRGRLLVKIVYKSVCTCCRDAREYTYLCLHCLNLDINV